MLESKIQKDVRKRFESTGWLTRKMVYQNRRGSPDVWCLGYEAVLVIIEFKQSKKPATTQQAREHDRLRERGFRVFVIDNIPDGYALHRRLEAERLA